MTRVLFVVGSSIRGGAQISLLRVLGRLDPDRFTVLLYCPDGFLADEAQRMGLDVHVGRVNVFGVSKIVKLIRQNRVDVVNTVLLKGAVIGALAMVISGRSAKLIVTVNNAILYPGISFWRRSGVIFAYLLLDSLEPIYLTKSEQVREELLCLPSLNHRHAFAVSNPIETEDELSLEDRPRFRHEFGIEDRKIAIGMIGAMTHQKGHRFLIEACPTIIANNPEIQFYFAGDGPLRSDLEAYASRICPAGHITFLGEIEDITNFSFAMDIIVLPSIFEGLPNVLLEVLALGRPVVATAVGGCEEVMHNGESGILVKPGSAQALADAVNWMAAHPESAGQMGRLAGETIRERFNTKRVVNEISNLLAQDPEASPKETAGTDKRITLSTSTIISSIHQ